MEDSTVVSCPTCGKKYKIAPGQMGRTFKCVGCQTQFQAGMAPDEEAGELEFAPSAPASISPSMATSMPPSMPPASGAMVPPSFDSGSMPSQMMKAKTSGMAIASLVCGILFCVPFCGLLAIIFGIIGINQTGQGQAKGRGMAITGLVLGCVGLVVGGLALLMSILLPSLNKARETANRAKCASNMNQIGLAIILYQNDNQQQYPPDLTTLMNTERLQPSVFVCPSSNDTPTPTPAQLESGGHCSYKYIYPGPMTGNMAMSMGANTAVLYEPFSDHSNDGTNILFADGHTEWFNRTAASRYIPNQ